MQSNPGNQARVNAAEARCKPGKLTKRKGELKNHEYRKSHYRACKSWIDGI